MSAGDAAETQHALTGNWQGNRAPSMCHLFLATINTMGQNDAQNALGTVVIQEV